VKSSPGKSISRDPGRGSGDFAKEAAAVLIRRRPFAEAMILGKPGLSGRHDHRNAHRRAATLVRGHVVMPVWLRLPVAMRGASYLPVMGSRSRRVCHGRMPDRRERHRDHEQQGE